MIEIDNVSFTYRGNPCASLQNCSINISAGEFVLLCGRSGCGKTTLTKLVNGLIPSQVPGDVTGRICIQGENVMGQPIWKRSQSVGSVFQNPRTQFFNLDTTSEIVFGLENKGVDRNTIKSRLQEVIAEYKLESLMDKSVFELSGGEKQKIAIAAAYTENPDIYVLDEPSANLDRIEVMRLQGLLQRLKQQGKTILIAEHHFWYLAGLVDRVLVMDRGRVIEEWNGSKFAAFTPKQCAKWGLRSVQPVQIEKTRQTAGQQESLTVTDLEVRRDRSILWEHLSINAQRGKAVALCGKNGSGKTTLAQVLCGLRKPAKGEIRLNGKRMTSKQLRKNSFLIMQDVNRQLFADSVLAEVMIGSQKSVEEAKDILQTMQLEEFLERHPIALSGGQKQRLAVADGCFCEKDIIIFDEPTSGLDLDNMKRVGELMQTLADKSKIIIVITHDAEFINHIQADVIQLDKRDTICG